MKKVMFLFLCSIWALNSNAQCSAVSNASTNRYGSTYTQHSNTYINRWFGNSKKELQSVFGVYPSFAFYQEDEGSNALSVGTSKVLFGMNMIAMYSENKAALLGIMAHEYAHTLQNTKYCSLEGKYRELHADLLAGYFLAAKGYVLGEDEVDNFINVFHTMGDYNFNDSDHHGTPKERTKAVRRGYYHFGLDDDLNKVYRESVAYINNNF
jgi:hypothetical protein